MSAEIRFVVIAASGAFILSVLTGLFSQVAFLPLLLRAFLSGAGFAALAAGAAFLARKFLPELLGEASLPEPSVRAAAPSSEPEHQLNIVLPGEGEEVPEELPAVPETLNPAKVGDVDLQEFEREAEEIGTDSLVPREPAENEATEETAARPPASFEDLDVLPDLDGLSDVFSTAANEEIGAGEAPAGDPISTTGASRDGVDAVTMAQAIRTLLKRDQKG